MKGNFVMKKSIAVIAATLLTTSIYAQDYDSKYPNSSTDQDLKSRQSEAGAPATTPSGQESTPGLEFKSSAGNTPTGQSDGANKGSSVTTDSDISTFNQQSQIDAQTGLRGNNDAGSDAQIDRSAPQSGVGAPGSYDAGSSGAHSEKATTNPNWSHPSQLNAQGSTDSYSQSLMERVQREFGASGAPASAATGGANSAHEKDYDFHSKSSSGAPGVYQGGSVRSSGTSVDHDERLRSEQNERISDNPATAPDSSGASSRTPTDYGDRSNAESIERNKAVESSGDTSTSDERSLTPPEI